MDIEDLRPFVEVANAGAVTAAASRWASPSPSSAGGSSDWIRAALAALLKATTHIHDLKPPGTGVYIPATP